MAAQGPQPISLDEARAGLTFLPDRTPATAGDEAGDAFALLSGYRDGGIFVGHWAGTTEWERHTAGDEIVLVLAGVTTIFFLVDGDEPSATLRAGELVVVPEGTWHRFETPERVELLSVTPQPTDHTAERPT